MDFCVGVMRPRERQPETGFARKPPVFECTMNIQAPRCIEEREKHKCKGLARHE